MKLRNIQKARPKYKTHGANSRVKRPHLTSVRTWFCYKFSTFKTSPAVTYNLIGRHQWRCKLAGVRLECATANQVPQSQADSQSGHGTSGP